MNKISTDLYQSKYAQTPHGGLLVDNIPLDIWLSRRLNWSDLEGLVPAQGWLFKKDEFEYARYMISSFTDYMPSDASEWNDAGTKIIVPILVCSDDCDFSCTVIVVEQQYEADEIRWNQLGNAFNSRSGLVKLPLVKWIKSSEPIATFNRNEFETSILRLLELCP